MDERIKIFNHEAFGKVRTLLINGEPWFIGKDVCEIFGDTHYRRSLARLDDDEKGIALIDTSGGRQKMTVVSESGLYSLLFYMQPQKAKGVTQNDTRMEERITRLKRFRRWITSEVLPSIRKTGGYVSNEELFMETYLPFADESVKELFRLNLTVIRQLNEKIEQDKPLVDFSNHVSASENLIDMGTMARLAKKENIPIGRTRLFKWLRKKGILMNNNLPYQRYIEAGYFEVKESVREFSTGTVIFPQTMVTGKGQQYIIHLLKAEYSND